MAFRSKKGDWGLAALDLDVVKRDKRTTTRLEGIGGHEFGIGKPLIGGCGARDILATLSKVRGETGEEGREGSKRVSGQDPICGS